MAINKHPFCIAILVVLLATVAVAQQRPSSRGQSPSQQARLEEARQCRLQRLTASQPNQRVESEGGVIELWNEFEDQFQCAGVAAARSIIQPNSLVLPHFAPSPHLVYIQQGQGLLGMSTPGCAESYHSRSRQSSPREGSQGQQRQQTRDQHQKVHRIRRGDIIAIPAGVAHWYYNDGNEELDAVLVSDLQNNANQLDQKLRAFYLAGSQPNRSPSFQGQQGRQGQQEQTFENVFRAFDENLMAEALNIPRDVVRRMQREDERGLIVKVRGDAMRIVRPEEEEDEESYQSRRPNGLEEIYCNHRISQYLDNPKEADIYQRQAGRINTVDRQKLPILDLIGMSAEKGSLYANSMHAPHWSMNAHSVVYVTRGDAHVQVVGSNGNTVLDERVNKGDLFVVPQYFVSTLRAGNNGFEYVAYKTSNQPMKSPLVGYTSAFKAMPIQVLTNSFQISSQEAQSLKYNREHHSMLLPPRTTPRTTTS